MMEKSGVQWYWNRDGSKAEWRLATFGGFLDDERTREGLINSIRAGGRAVSLKAEQCSNIRPGGPPTKQEWGGVEWELEDAPPRTILEFI